MNNKDMLKDCIDFLKENQLDYREVSGKHFNTYIDSYNLEEQNAIFRLEKFDIQVYWKERTDNVVAVQFYSGSSTLHFLLKKV